MWTRLATARFNLEGDKFSKDAIKYVHGGNQYEMKPYPTAPVPVVIIKMRIWLFFRNSLSILFRRDSMITVFSYGKGMLKVHETVRADEVPARCVMTVIRLYSSTPSSPCDLGPPNYGNAAFSTFFISFIASSASLLFCFHTFIRLTCALLKVLAPPGILRMQTASDLTSILSLC
ncbi:hypothetical protein OIDMADRAFT_32714 [Oidiodendron maius Zn]|uniref:Uncharacterized protein n=1 Tax=Oidiodendron maius (strain Zn) TaxID=913774 RepID=A0A0C3H076_OIDMZ|nr:hypothetical protein OIDMADRAFT_32714 [Oidiodendron maius Zn]